MLDLSSLFAMLIGPMAIIVALAHIVGIVYRTYELSALQGQVLLSAAFSVAVLYTMMHPVTVPQVGMFDVRALVIGLGVALVSPLVGVITCVTAIFYRVHVGGPGVEAGVATIFLAFTASYAWRMSIQNAKRGWVFKSAILGMMISMHLLALFLLPSGALGALWAHLVPFFVIANFSATMAFYLLIEREISQITQTTELREASLTDPLTGLRNRRGFDRAFDAHCGKSRSQSGTGLLLIDVDNFKEINDRFGHPAGDATLIALAKAMSAHLRPGDSLARIGGDEFALLLPDTDRKTTCLLSRAILSGAAKSTAAGPAPTVSIGMAWATKGADRRTLEEAADRALYASKARGRNCVCSQTLDPTRSVPCPMRAKLAGPPKLDRMPQAEHAA